MYSICFNNKRRNPYLEWRSLVHGGESHPGCPLLEANCQLCAPLFPFPPLPIPAITTFIYIQMTLTCLLPLDRAHSSVDVGCRHQTLVFFPSNRDAVSSVSSDGVVVLAAAAARIHQGYLFDSPVMVISSSGPPLPSEGWPLTLLHSASSPLFLQTLPSPGRSH
jgi:hypothetical protein